MYIERLTEEDYIKLNITSEEKTIFGTIPVHGHEFYEIELILNGEGTYTIDGVDYKIERGALFFMNPASFHIIRCTADTTLVNIMFNLNTCSPELLHPLFVSTSHVHTVAEEEDTVFLRTVSAELARCLRNKSINRNYSALLLNTIIGKISGIIPASEQAAGFSAMQKVVLYIHSSFKHQLTLKDVANVANLSPSYLSEQFRKYTGMTFKSYLSKLRFSYAEKLLAYTDMSVTQVCFDCGFNDYSHFLTSFKSRYGVTPSAYRKNPTIQ